MIPVFRALVLFSAWDALAQQPAAPATDSQSAFLSIPPAAFDALRFGAQLPQFEAKDIDGRIWRLTDLRGKLTLIYVWHTFDARSTDRIYRQTRERIQSLPDLPEVQRFYDKWKNAKNLQVLTFCRDYDYTHAPEYMKQAGYTFPVIADWVLVKKLFPGQWGASVVNAEGRLSEPFRSWTFGRILIEVERTAAQN